MDPRTFKQEFEASFELPSNALYQYFTREGHGDDPGNVIPCPFDKRLPLLVGLDFNLNPMAVVLYQMHGPQWWVVDSHEMMNASTRRMAEWLLEWGGKHYGDSTDNGCLGAGCSKT